MGWFRLSSHLSTKVVWKCYMEAYYYEYTYEITLLWENNANSHKLTLSKLLVCVVS